VTGSPNPGGGFVLIPAKLAVCPRTAQFCLCVQVLVTVPGLETLVYAATCPRCTCLLLLLHNLQHPRNSQTGSIPASFLLTSPGMSEAAKSSVAKSVRVLYIANPGDSDGSSDEEDAKSFQAATDGTSRPHGYTYQPPPLPDCSPRSPHGARPIHPQYAPSPLTTNLPLDKKYHSQSSHSNPALSSPSSTSSPAVDTTPPPSTPGLGAPTIDLPGDVSVRQEPHDGHIGTRVTNMFGKILKHKPHRSSPQRTSGNSFHVNTVCLFMSWHVPVIHLIVFLKSPTASTPESYTSPTNTRPATSEKLLIMVTTDADQYLTVDVTGPKSAAIIRERIFTRVGVFFFFFFGFSLAHADIDTLLIVTRFRRRSSSLFYLPNKDWGICNWRSIDRRATARSLS
jgi:hypothetical protein